MKAGTVSETWVFALFYTVQHLILHRATRLPFFSSPRPRWLSWGIISDAVSASMGHFHFENFIKQNTAHYFCCQWMTLVFQVHCVNSNVIKSHPLKKKKILLATARCQHTIFCNKSVEVFIYAIKIICGHSQGAAVKDGHWCHVMFRGMFPYIILFKRLINTVYNHVCIIFSSWKKRWSGPGSVKGYFLFKSSSSCCCCLFKDQALGFCKVTRDSCDCKRINKVKLKLNSNK